MKFSLIIPCYNEAENLPLLLERCKELVRQPSIEVVLVDNGSTDSTAALLQERLPGYPGCRGIRVESNRGYGFGILSGLRVAKGDILGWTHADMQTDPRDTLRGLELFAKHGDGIFVKGRRCGRPLADAAFAVGMSALETLLLAEPLWDVNAQPTMFSRGLRDIWRNTVPHDFSLDLYAYYCARRRGLAVHRFPVRFSKRVYGVSRWNGGWAEEGRLARRTLYFSRELRRNFET